MRVNLQRDWTRHRTKSQLKERERVSVNLETREDIYNYCLNLDRDRQRQKGYFGHLKTHKSGTY